MKVHLDCIPCFIKQSLEASRMATDDPAVQEKVLKKVMNHLKDISYEDSPPELSREVHAIIKKITKNNDPYKKVKIESNEMARKIFANLKKTIEQSEDPLLTAIKISIVGNVIDYGTMDRYNVDDMIDNALHRDFDCTDYDKFKEQLEKSKTILYLADNTGEIYFDKLLLEKLKEMDKEITFVVKSNPIINDALKEDTITSGIDKLANIICCDDGQTISTPGVVLNYASKDFLDLFEKSDMIIAKGQGNYEGLSEVERKVFFMLVAKCPLVANDIKTNVGKLILKVNK